MSIIIPAYGECAQRNELLQSLLAEPAACNAEILVVDDGSPTPIEPSLRATLLAFPDARCLRKENGGGPSARNFGAAQAVGRRLLFIDQDLKLPRDFVPTMLGVAQEFPDTAVSALYENRFPDTTTPFARWYGAQARKWEDAGRVGAEIAPGVIEVHPILMSSTSLIIDRGLYLGCGGMPVYPRTGVEDQALGLLLGRRGVRVLRTDRATPVHIEARADLPSFCARQREGAAATVRLISDFPEVFGPVNQTAQHKAHGPVRLLRESPLVALKKVLKAEVMRQAGPILFPLISWFDRGRSGPPVVKQLYAVLVAAHIQAGWREGLMMEIADAARSGSP